MKRKIIYIIALIICGWLAYYGGYYLYTAQHSRLELPKAENVQKSSGSTVGSEEYYIGKIEDGLLMIYQMPEESLYDSVKLSTLQLYNDEEQRLTDGVIFEDLTEVFEFLENSMS